MLSIAHYHPCLTGSGGDRVSESELRYLAGQGHRVSFLVAYDPCGYEETFAQAGAQWAAFHGHDVSVQESRRSACEVMPEAVRFLQEQQADLLHCHNVSILPQALMLSRAAGIPLFVTLHTRREKWAKWRWSHKPRRRRQFAMIREALAESKGLFAVSQPVLDDAVKLFGGAARHGEFFPNPLHDVFFEPAESSADRDYDVAILGRPVPVKDPRTIARALAQLVRIRPGTRIVWLGASGDEELIRRHVSDPVLRAAVEFRGKLPPSAVREALLRTKALFLPSLREGNPLAVGEAALCGCRLVLSDIPALRAHYRVPGAWIFPVRNVARAVDALRAALEPSAPQPDAAALGLLDERTHGERLLRAYQKGLR